VIHATCEDYRAGATVDVEDDMTDRGHRRIACPVLALWAAGEGARDAWDSLGIWRAWAGEVEGGPIPGGHFLPEESPTAVLTALRAFLDR
jgi:haloacetate dehalogenase